MDMLLERVRPRLRDPPYNHPLDFGERLDWENQKAQIEFLGYGSGYQGRGTVPPESERAKEVNKVIKTWAFAQPHADRIARYEGWEEGWKESLRPS